MFARVYRISKVFNNKRLRTIAVRENDVMRLCAPFWILWLVYHVLWMVSQTLQIVYMHHIKTSVRMLQNLCAPVCAYPARTCNPPGVRRPCSNNASEQ